MKCDELSSSESDERGEITSEREFAIHCEDLEILKNLVKRLHYIRENNGIFNLIHLILINIFKVQELDITLITEVKFSK